RRDRVPEDRLRLRPAHWCAYIDQPGAAPRGGHRRPCRWPGVPLGATPMSRPKPLSGFPEWTPEQRIVEQALLDHLRGTFELHGFSSIETRSVEPLTTLLSEGETSKEVYALRRASADPDEGQGELGLHFDLTVPTARYVLEHAPTLAFPWRRYQI